jgi:hypothetical protein
MVIASDLSKKCATSSAFARDFGGGGVIRSGEAALVGGAEDPAVGSRLAGESDRGGAVGSCGSSLLSLVFASSKSNSSSDKEPHSVRSLRTTRRGAGCVRLPRTMVENRS